MQLYAVDTILLSFIIDSTEVELAIFATIVDYRIELANM
jgi:hypothetical protein